MSNVNQNILLHCQSTSNLLGSAVEASWSRLVSARIKAIHKFRIIFEKQLSPNSIPCAIVLLTFLYNYLFITENNVVFLWYYKKPPILLLVTLRHRSQSPRFSEFNFHLHPRRQPIELSYFRGLSVVLRQYCFYAIEPQTPFSYSKITEAPHCFSVAGNLLDLDFGFKIQETGCYPYL